jgi:hypothetical protein
MMGAVVELRTPCCICGRRLRMHEGNRPHPVKASGKCCNDCNVNVVIPARMAAFDAAFVAAE